LGTHLPWQLHCPRIFPPRNLVLPKEGKLKNAQAQDAYGKQLAQMPEGNVSKSNASHKLMLSILILQSFADVAQ
jgi:hypothetical protein